MQTPVFFDYASTTPADLRVVKKMNECLTIEGTFGNPASKTHPFGWQADHRVELARKQVASLINAEPREIIWTSGATESDNMALKGVAAMYQGQGKHLITMATEHKAVLDCCAFLEKQGFEVTYLKPESDGVLDLKKLEQAFRPDTILVSIMHVNNETGVIQDIEAIGSMVKSRNILFHVDAAQSAGKVPIDVESMKVDLLSLSGHKIYGPKGVGAIYIRRKPRVRLQPLMHGGGHEQGYRSGTLATHQIVGMGEAFAMAEQLINDEVPKISALRDRLWQGIQKLDRVKLNGHPERRVCGILNVAFEGIDGEMLIKAIPQLAVASGSACTSASINTSHVLRAYGLNDELAHASIRFSLGRYTTEEQVDYAVNLLQEKIPLLQAA